MKITRTSMLTRATHTLDIDVSELQLEAYYRGGKTIQEAFPHLSDAEREFILSGITAEEWLHHVSIPVGEGDEK